MHTFKASSKEPQNCACLCLHHWLDLHVYLSGQRPKPGNIKDHVICLWWFDFRLEPIFTIAPAASKNNA